MAEVGEALAAEGLARKDMSPGDAGMNDLLHQLHIAIFRQQDVEPNKGCREKTINLYNVLGFGWALGHEFRDKDGDIAILYPEDLDPLVRNEGRGMHTDELATRLEGAPMMPLGLVPNC